VRIAPGFEKRTVVKLVMNMNGSNNPEVLETINTVIITIGGLQKKALLPTDGAFLT
jgi:hypothetical protein